MYRLKQEGEEYNLLQPWLTLDSWQYEYIQTKGNCALLTGRQVGKSTAMSIKAGELAVKHYKKGENILIIALTERQAFNIFEKTFAYISAVYPQMVMKGKEKPTKHEINLKNGVKIMCHPTGLMGEGLRGFTVKHIFADEASRIGDQVYTAITPMLSVVSGSMDLASTPCGKQGYFWRCCNDLDLGTSFKRFYVNAEDCPRHSKEFLEGQKKSMSNLEYAQEYLAVFLDDLKRLFSDELIQKCCVARRKVHSPKYTYYLGVDIARLGEDDSTFEIIEKVSKDKYEHIESIITSKQLLTQTTTKIIELEKVYHFKEINIDAGAGGLGVAIFDSLLENDLTKRKVVAINNRARSYDRDGTQKAKLLKEDLYNNLLGVMERGEIKLLNDDDVIESLKSVQWEYIIKEGKGSQLRIFGNYTHVVEGLIRAVWGASKDKRLNPIIA